MKEKAGKERKQEPSEVVIRRTTSTDVMGVQISQNPMKHFEGWPLHETRLKCLKRIQELGIWRKEQARWMENCIRQFAVSGDALRDEVIECYLFGARGIVVARAVEFVINETEGLRSFLRSKNAKLISGLLCKYENWRHQTPLEGKTIYEAIPSLRGYLAEMLYSPVNPNLDYEPLETVHYSFEEWIQVERALKVILTYDDEYPLKRQRPATGKILTFADEEPDFLDIIEKIIEFYGQGRIEPLTDSSSDLSQSRAVHLATFKEARRRLKLAVKEAEKKTAVAV